MSCAGYRASNQYFSLYSAPRPPRPVPLQQTAKHFIYVRPNQQISFEGIPKRRTGMLSLNVIQRPLTFEVNLHRSNVLKLLTYKQLLCNFLTNFVFLINCFENESKIFSDGKYLILYVPSRPLMKVKQSHDRPRQAQRVAED